MLKDKIDVRPLLIRVGVVVALSFAGLFIIRLKSRSRSSQPTRSSERDNGVDTGEGKARFADDSSTMNKPAGRYDDGCMVKIAVENSSVVLSPSGRSNSDTDGSLLSEFNDLVKDLDFKDFDFIPSYVGISPKANLETPRLDMEAPKIATSDEEDEIRHLKHRVKMLQERERNLEVQLLEFYGLKEQEMAMEELQNSLKIYNMEAKFLNLNIESLKADNQRLRSQVADNAKVVAELDAARAKVKMLKKKLRYETEQNKDQILSLHQRVSRLQGQELSTVATDSGAQVKLQRLKELESEVEQLRNSNSRLQIENSELARQLDSAQALANSILEDPETGALRQLSNQLRQENTALAEEVERLQTDRCTDAEELVYLRWVNACLRYELRNFQPSQGKTLARDLSKTMSPKSEEKVKRLILEYANTQGVDEKEIDAMDFERYQSDYDDSFLSSKTCGSGNIKFLKKLKRLLGGKDVSSQDNGSSLAAEDLESQCGSSCMSTTTELPSDLPPNRVHTRSLSLSRHSSRQSSRRSLSMQRVKIPTKMADVKDVENSHLGRSFRARRTFWSTDLSVERQDDQDSHPPSFEEAELMKFAGALKNSGNNNRQGNLHKKSASVGSFESLHHKNASGLD